MSLVFWNAWSLEGRIPTLFSFKSLADISLCKLCKHASHWFYKLYCTCFESLTFSFWNGTVHLSPMWTSWPHSSQWQWDVLAQKCEDPNWTDPTILLEDDRYFFMFKFWGVFLWPVATRQVWVSEVEAACSDAWVLWQGTMMWVIIWTCKFQSLWTWRVFFVHIDVAINSWE